MADGSSTMTFAIKVVSSMLPLSLMLATTPAHCCTPPVTLDEISTFTKTALPAGYSGLLIPAVVVSARGRGEHRL